MEKKQRQRHTARQRHKQRDRETKRNSDTDRQRETDTDREIPYNEDDDDDCVSINKFKCFSTLTWRRYFVCVITCSTLVPARPRIF